MLPAEIILYCRVARCLVVDLVCFLFTLDFAQYEPDPFNPNPNLQTSWCSCLVDRSCQDLTSLVVIGRVVSG